MKNIDPNTVLSFGDEWAHFDQKALSEEEHAYLFETYFNIFPWDELPSNSKGFDMGCGSGRWAALVAPRVGHLMCIDASADALFVARRKLSKFKNISYTDKLKYKLEYKYVPIGSVAIYVPGSTASYPSSVLMNAIPAIVAGVKRLVMVPILNWLSRIV